MKQSNLSFAEGFLGVQAKIAKGKGSPFKIFDWDAAAEIIKDRIKTNPNIKIEAGLQGDWDHTGGVIYENGNPVNDSYTYLASNWATPTLIISLDYEEIEEIACFTIDPNTRFDEKSKWDETSLQILNS